MPNMESTMASRQKRSARYFIDTNGDEVDRMEQATGAGYALVTDNGAEHMHWEQQMGAAGDIRTMHAVIGWWTKLGNVVNTVVNDKDSPGTLDDAAVAVTEHVENCLKGIWREVTEGVARGPKYDKDILAGALLAVLTRENKAKGDLANYRLRLDDKSYAAKVRARGDVMAQYYQDLQARGNGDKPVAAIDDLA
jgi:hypothetical protein